MNLLEAAAIISQACATPAETRAAWMELHGVEAVPQVIIEALVTIVLLAWQLDQECTPEDERGPESWRRYIPASQAALIPTERLLEILGDVRG